MNNRITFFILLAFAMISFSRLQAYPRFAAYTGDKCADCHVNPSGGLMRNEAGIEGAKKFLNMELFKKIAAKTEFSPKLTKSISVGGDIRVVQADEEVPNKTNFNTFLTMQGDLYINAQLNDVLNVFVTSGMEIPNFPTKYEAYGMISNLPAGAYFRAGRFSPNYGIRIPEHRAYTRQVLLNAPYTQADGFEVGISPEFFNFSAGIFNGLNTNFFDADSKKMIVTSADFTFSFADFNYNFNFGGSFYNDPYSPMDPVTQITTNANRKAFGPFVKIGILKRVSLLGELDFSENSGNNLGMRRGMIGFGELNIRLIQGVELRGQYEFYDPNRDIDDNEIRRISAGMTFFPFFGFETEAFVRFVSEEPGVDNNEFQWSFHYYF